MKINGKTIAKAKLSDLVELNPETMAKLTKKETRQLEKRLREATERRMNTINKYGMRSMAFERYLGNQMPVEPEATASRQSLQHKVVQMKTFLGAKTSSVTGIRKLNKEVEQRIFKGKAKGFENEEQRIRFWKTYNEFLNQYPTYVFSSERVQQFLGQSQFWRYRDFTADDLVNLMEKVSPGFERMRVDAGLDIQI